MNEIERAIEIVSDLLDAVREFRGTTQEEADKADELIELINELEQYRSIGTVGELTRMKADYAEAICDWRQYRKIGTLEECRAAVEKLRANIKPKQTAELPAIEPPKRGRPKTKVEEPEKPRERRKIDIGKIMALKNAGWSAKKIGEEMDMTEMEVNQAIYRYRRKMAEKEIGGEKEERKDRADRCGQAD